MRPLCFFGIAVCACIASACAAVSVSGLPAPAERLLKDQWTAQWITHPEAPKNEFGVYLFRKNFDLQGAPAHFVVHVTGDARYRLFVNGKSVSFGPQRSDTWVCHYDSIDLAPFLRSGTNTLAARVWNYGDLAPYAVTSVRTGFLLQGESVAEESVNTDASWQAVKDGSYLATTITLPTYIVIGPNLQIDGAAHPWDWLDEKITGSRWVAARLLGKGIPYGWGTDMDRWLKPRTIPLMEETRERFESVRRSSGVKVGANFLQGSAPLTIPANSRATILVDNGVETNAFPQLVLSLGRGARVSLTYAEALIDGRESKGPRGEIEGRKIVGVSDLFVAEGGERRVFSPLDFRTYRYVEVGIETAEEPLRVDDLFGVFTGYPFTERGAFTSDDPELKQIWEVGWRTARLCAMETYVDCPYYEQLQYVGDTRIQALISLYVAGDDRLMRNAIEQYDRSRIAEGLTQSRYPSVTPQLINTFSLFWVEMVHDYWMHREDDVFLQARLGGVQAVLAWFEKRIDRQTGLLGPLEYWTFVDWTDQWPWEPARGIGGEPEGARSGGSSIVSLQFAGTLSHAAELFAAYGRGDLAQHYTKLADLLRQAVVKHCWDDQRRMFADSAAKKAFSQHANAMAVLAGAIGGKAATDLMQRTLADKSLIQCSTYFRFYLLRALKQAGLGDEYLAQLGPWRTMLELGLTTFAEKPEPTRSDCHAWSASPVYEFLATVCGVEPASPGFATVKIQPHLGGLKNAEGVIPHPAGDIRVKYIRAGESVKAVVALPAGLNGEFVWKGTRRALVAGEQTFEIR